MLNRQFDNLARLEQRHDGFLMSNVPDVCRVHRQDSVAHPQLARGSCRTSGYDLTDIDSLKHLISVYIHPLLNLLCLFSWLKDFDPVEINGLEFD